ncbi:MAG: extracellular solute-binding protein [Armatimonadetes bacterium]|nr:extracellular solute-binding protein [Armatimonadota bacterium]
MSLWKPILAGVFLLAVLVALYPSRRSGLRDRAGVVEIVFMGPGGPIRGAMEDAVRDFEEASRQVHAGDPSQPIYRVISGQNAARDQVSDPTRFLISVDDRALIYNKDLLKRAGLVDGRGEAHPPVDWEELKEYAVKLTERDEQGRLKVIGFAPNFGNCWLYMYGWMAGGEFMSPEGDRCTLNDPRIVEALSYMVEVYDAIGGYAEVSAFQAGFQSGELDPFIQGKVAMKIDGGWQMSFLAAYGQEVSFGVSAPPLPRREILRGRQTVTWNGGWAYAIPATARNKDAAWAFIRHVTSDRAIRLMVESDREIVEAQGRLFIPGQSPVVHLNELFFAQYVAGNPLVPEKIREGSRIFKELLPDARFRPITPVGQLLWNEHRSAMEAALYHELTPKEALDRGTAIVQRDLDRLLQPQRGRPVSWEWFFAAYAVLLLFTATVVFLWDTRARFRRGVGRLLRLESGTVDRLVEGSRGGYFRRQWRGGYACAAPWMIGFIVFGGGPMLFSILMSFCDYDVLNPPRLIGFQNYTWMFTEDRLFPLALWNTVYMVLGVPLAMAVSLGLALLLNARVRGIAVWRTFFYLPAVVPMVAASILWIWMFNPQGGLFNLALGSLGVEGPLWLQDARWSKPSIIVMGLWGAGSGMIIWLAGLKSIPEELYEAASLDGASAWQQFRHVTLPQLSPYLFFNLVMGLIGTFQIFGQAFIMTQGGPVNSTLFYVYHLFNQAFRYGHMGYASAMAWFLFLIVMGVTLVQVWLSRRWVHYEV